MEKQLLVGAHLNTSAGFATTFKNADKISAQVIQIFLKSNRTWLGPSLSDLRVKEFKTAKTQSAVKLVVAHASYLINLAAAKDEILQKSILALIDEVLRCEKLGIPYLVLHPGCFTTSSRETGLTQVSQALNKVLSKTNGSCLLLLENMAGQGSTLGANFEELATIRNSTHETEKIGFCLDTCHAFAAGYNFSTEKDLTKMLETFDNACGIHNLKIVHLNDSKEEFASRKDRHENIGTGKIGLTVLQKVLQHPKLKQLAFILETPVDDSPTGYLVHKEEISLLKI